MFKEEGTGLLNNMKAAREMLKKDDKTTKEKEWEINPPPYSNGQFPVKTGHVEIRGEVEMTEEEEAVTPGATCAPSHSTDRNKKRTVKNPSTEGDFNCYEGLRKALATMETVKNEKEI